MLFRGNYNQINDNKALAHLNLSYPQKPGRLHPFVSNDFLQAKPRQKIETEKHSSRRSSDGLYRKGSLSLEAAIVFSLFLMVLTAIVSFIPVLQVQLRIQSAMEKAASQLASAYYAAEEIRGNSQKENSLIAGLGEDIVCYLVSENLVRGLIQEDVEGTVSETVVEGGSDGLSFLGTRYDDQKDDIVVCVSYRVKIPYISAFSMRISQKAVHHAWVGESENYEANEQVVYITQHGEVYHTSLSCTYLDLSVNCVDFQQVGGLRSKSGKIYYLCDYCDDKEGKKVFVTGYGERYHFDRNCSGLKRSIFGVPISQVGDRRECSRCKSRGDS